MGPSKGRRISQVCTAILLFLLAGYFIYYCIGVKDLSRRVKTSISGPYAINRSLREIQKNISHLRFYAENLKTHSDLQTIGMIKIEVPHLYFEIEEDLQFVRQRFQDPHQEVEDIFEDYQDLKIKQDALLEMAGSKDLAEIAEFVELYLNPRYAQINADMQDVFNITDDMQRDLYFYSGKMEQESIFWSFVFVSSTAFMLLLLQVLLKWFHQKLYQKNFQFDLLSFNIDETFLIFDRNKKCCDFVAANIERVLGIPFESIKDDRGQLYSYMDGLSAGVIHEKMHKNGVTEKQWRTQIRFKRPDTGQLRSLDVCFYHVGGEKYIATLFDRTKEDEIQQNLRDALLQAQNADNAKRDFLSRMSHEIRTPMNAIIGMTEIASACLQDREKVKDCLVKIGYSSRHLLLLINDILDMSRIENNKMMISREPFDFYELIGQLGAVFMPQAKQKGVKFSQSLIGFEQDGNYLGDALRINQILLNLLSNAVKFTPEGGEILLEITRLPSKDKLERIRFLVKDNGIGMTEEALARIFDPFEQADATITRRFGGSGLGMSITKNLVTLMDGFIEVKSKPGAGTCCMVEIPFEKAGFTMPDSDSISSLRVLAVTEDRSHLTKLLEKMRVSAAFADTVPAVSEELLKARDAGKPFDICILDRDLPGLFALNGDLFQGEGAPVIVLAASAFMGEEECARHAGVVVFLKKPVTDFSLYRALLDASRKKRLIGKIKTDMPLAGLRILVAEDNELNWEITKELLRLHGAQAECAVDGEKAVKAFLSHEPGYFDAILMDVQMPVLDGYGAARRIRASGRPDAGKIPMLAATANAFPEDVSQAAAAGMDGHIAKPIDMERLINALLPLLDK